MSAAYALNLPEIVAAILEHLHPDEVHYEVKNGPQIACHHRDLAAGLTALSAAARVNSLWFSEAVPILWQRPLEDALSTNSVTDPARCAFYAKHIHEVHLSRCSPLWCVLALPQPSADGGAADDGGGRLRLPKLVTLDISHVWQSSDGFRGALRDQAPLLWLVGPSLRRLVCHLAPELFDRLEALQQQLLTQHGDAAAAAAAWPPPARQPSSMQLRDLSLSGYRVHRGGIDVRSQKRLVAWLSSCQRLVRHLARVRLHAVLPIDAARLALHHLGPLGTLKELLVYPHPDEGDDPEKNGFFGDDILGHRPACLQGSCYCHMNISRPVRGFEGVQSFTSTLGVHAIPSLLTLMPALRELSMVLERHSADEAVENNNNNNNHSNEASISRVIELLTKLPRLQSLRLVCRHALAPADIRLFQSLSQLQSLELLNDGETDAADEDIAALLRALPRLHTSRCEGRMPRLSTNALYAIGSVSSQLRLIQMPCTQWLPDKEQQSPLFPLLEVLEIYPLDRYIATIHR
jgi:hypothetical protein